MSSNQKRGTSKTRDASNTGQQQQAHGNSLMQRVQGRLQALTPQPGLAADQQRAPTAGTHTAPQNGRGTGIRNQSTPPVGTFAAPGSGRGNAVARPVPPQPTPNERYRQSLRSLWTIDSGGEPLPTLPDTPSPANLVRRPAPTSTPANQVSGLFTPSGGPQTTAQTLPGMTPALLAGARNAVQGANISLPPNAPDHARNNIIAFVAATNHAVPPVRAMGLIMRAGWDPNVAMERWLAARRGEYADEEEGEEEIEEEDMVPDDTELGDPEPDELPLDKNGNYQKPAPKASPSKATPSKVTHVRATPTKRTPTVRKNYTVENPNVDRSAARRGIREPEKEEITLSIEGELRHFKWAKTVENWESAEEVERLNRWRQQVFRRWLGTVRARVIPYHPDENQWIIDLYRNAHNANRRVNWSVEDKAFNARFAGRILPGADVPRQARTKGSLMTQAHRIPEVGNITGLKVRGNRASMTPANPGTTSGTNSGTKHGASSPSADALQPPKFVKPNEPAENEGGDDDEEKPPEGGQGISHRNR